MLRQGATEGNKALFQNAAFTELVGVNVDQSLAARVLQLRAEDCQGGDQAMHRFSIDELLRYPDKALKDHVFDLRQN